MVRYETKVEDGKKVLVAYSDTGERLGGKIIDSGVPTPSPGTTTKIETVGGKQVLAVYSPTGERLGGKIIEEPPTPPQQLASILKEARTKGYEIPESEVQKLKTHIAKYPSEVYTEETKEGLIMGARSKEILGEKIPEEAKLMSKEEITYYEPKKERFEKEKKLLEPWYKAKEKIVAPFEVIPEEPWYTKYGKTLVRIPLEFGATAAVSAATLGVAIGHAIKKPKEVGEIFKVGAEEMKVETVKGVKELPKWIKEHPAETAAYVTIIAAPIVESAIPAIRHKLAVPKTAFKEVTKKVGEKEMVVGIAKTEITGKEYPSIYTGIAKGKGETGKALTAIVTETEKGKMKTLAATKYLMGEGEPTKGIAATRYISEVAGKTIKGKTAEAFAKETIEGITGTKAIVDVGKLHFIKGISKDLTDIPEHISDYGAKLIQYKPLVGNIIGETVKKVTTPSISLKPLIPSTMIVAKPLEPKVKPTEITVPRKVTIEYPQPKIELFEKAYPKKKPVAEEYEYRVKAPGEPTPEIISLPKEAYFSKVGTLMEKEAAKVIGMKPEITQTEFTRDLLKGMQQVQQQQRIQARPRVVARESVQQQEAALKQMYKNMQAQAQQQFQIQRPKIRTRYKTGLERVIQPTYPTTPVISIGGMKGIFPELRGRKLQLGKDIGKGMKIHPVVDPLALIGIKLPKKVKKEEWI